MDGPVQLTDVRQQPAGTWLAQCECGLRLPVATEVDGWAWVVAHECRWPGRTAGSLRGVLVRCGQCGGQVPLREAARVAGRVVLLCTHCDAVVLDRTAHR